MPWIHRQEGPEAALRGAKKWIPRPCPEEGMCREEDICREDAEEAEQGTYVKLSVTHVTKRDISVAIAPSIHGINQAIAARAIGPRTPVKGEK